VRNNIFLILDIILCYEYIMSFFRAQRAQALRSSVCSSSNLAICNDFRRIGVNQITYGIQTSVPGAPTITSSSVSGTTLTINFTQSSTGGSAVTNYQYSLNNGVTYTAFSPAVITSPLTITGLSAGSSYSVLVKAVNDVGIGASSDVLSVTVPTVPFAPYNLTYTTSTGSATISFTAGLNGGSSITNYRYSTNGGSTFTAFSPVDTASPVTISGLTAGQTYSVVLQAVNAIGNGISSSALSVVMPASTPSAPTNLSSSNISSTSATVSFTAGSNGGSAITNYKYSTDGTTYTAVSPASTNTSINITGLSSGTTYNIYVKAVNAVGDGTASSALSVKTLKIPASLVFSGSNNLKLTPGVAIGSGAYTIETWFYLNATPNNNAILGGGVDGVSACLSIFYISPTTISTDSYGGLGSRSYTINAASIGNWHHFVLVRNSSLLETVFIDGTRSVNQITNNLNYSGVSRDVGASYGNSFWNGYLANFRIVVGTAVYDPTASSITVPTSPLTNITNTKYLMVGDTITNDGSSIQTVTNVSNVTLSTSQVPI
jgi:Fibronectin type III domain